VEEHLTTSQVAEALSVSESSVKRWCNSGVIPMVRTVGGHRRIPLEGFLAFLEQTNRRVQVPLSGVDDELPEVGLSSSVVPQGDESAVGGTQELLHRFQQAIERGDEATCRRLLTSLYAAKTSFAAIADQFVAAAFRGLGDRWDCGQLEVYQERRGCEICSRVLHEFRRLVPAAPDNAPLALGGAPEGDQYSLPSQLVDLVLQESGWRTMNLGSNLPLSTIAAAVQQHAPRLLWLSVSHLEDSERFVEQYQTFRQSLPSELLVIVGGRALHDSLRPRLQYTGHCDNMLQLADFAVALRGKRPSLEISNN
jgi:excisionase family DNA binding protein